MAREKKERGKKDHIIEGCILLGIGVVFMLVLVGAFGKAGKAVTDFLVGSFGYAVYAYFLAMIIFGVLSLCNIKRPKMNVFRTLSLVLFFAMVIALLHCVSSMQYMGNGYGKYLVNCYENHNTAGGVVAGVFLYPLLFVNYLGVIICSLLAVASAGIFAFYDSIFVRADKNAEQEEMTPFEELGAGSGFEIVGSDLLVTDASNGFKFDDKSIDSEEYVPLNAQPTSKVDFGIFGENRDSLTSKYTSLNQREIARKQDKEQKPQKAEEKSTFDKAYDILYGKGKKEEEKEEEQEKEQTFDLGDRKEYLSWTNDYRKQQILDNMNSSPKDKDKDIKKDIDNEKSSDVKNVFDFGKNYFSAQDVYTDKADKTDKPEEKKDDFGIFGSKNSFTLFNKEEDKEETKSEIKYDDFVKSSNENSSSLMEKLASYNNEEVKADNIDINTEKEEETVNFGDIDKMEVEDKTATHREIDGFEHLLRHQKEERDKKQADIFDRRHRLGRDTQVEDSESNDEEVVRRERIRKERSDKGGSHNSSKQQETINSSVNSFVQDKKEDLQEDITIAEQVVEQKVETKPIVEKVTEEVKREKTKVKLAPYKYPPIELLANYENKPKAAEDFADKIEILENTLSEFGIDAKVNRVVTGPTFTRLELVMPKGVSVKRVLNYVDDVAMCLEVKSVRFQVPIPGKNAFGVEIPNADRGKVGLKSVIQSEAFTNSRSKIAFAVGQNCDGENYVADLAAMPHLLIAGATGAGKSVCLNSLIVSLLYKYTPDELKLLLVDPKQVELNMYNRIPHMLIPEAISDKTMALNMLDWAIEEMEARYTLFKDKRVQKITDYNATIDPKKEDKLPYIVIIIDEVGDFMLVIKKELEERIQRLTQKARAAGIHLILATQRPSVDVITGVIKANLPARIAFAVTNFADSKTILDQGGAEKLLRYGDMIFSDGVQEPSRLQGTLVEGTEVNAICDYIRANNECYFDKDIEEFICNTANSNAGANPAQVTFGESSGEQDDLFIKALYHVVTTGAVSISKLQRKFGIGFPRAARLVDTMEELGYIASSKDNAKQKDIVIDMETFRSKYGDAKLD